MNDKKNKFNLTEGPILQKMLALSLPIMATSAMQMAYNLTDMFWMGRLSSGSVAAVGTAGQFLWLSMALMSIGRMGAEIGVSQNMGKGDPEAAKSFAQNAFILSAVLGTLYAAVMIIFRVPLIGFFNIDNPQVVLESQQYLMFSAMAIPFILMHNVITGCFNGFGNTKLPFYINSLGLALNIIISPLLIFVAGLGIIGAAIGTVIASAINLILKILAIKKYHSRPFESFEFMKRIDKEKIRQIFKWGIPVAVESMFFTLLFMVVSRLVASFGVGAIAAQRVGVQIESLSFMIGGGFAMAFTSFVGQNYGAKKWDRLRVGYKVSTVVMASYGVLVTIFLFLLAEPLVAMFLNYPDEIRMGTDYVRIIALTQFLFCMEGVATGYFRGRGLTIKPTIVGVSCNILRVFLTYFLASTSLGITGVWVGIAIIMTMRSVWLLTWRFMYSRKVAVLEREGFVEEEEQI